MPVKKSCPCHWSLLWKKDMRHSLNILLPMVQIWISFVKNTTKHHGIFSIAERISNHLDNTKQPGDNMIELEKHCRQNDFYVFWLRNDKKNAWLLNSLCYIIMSSVKPLRLIFFNSTYQTFIFCFLCGFVFCPDSIFLLLLRSYVFFKFYCPMIEHISFNHFS